MSLFLDMSNLFHLGFVIVSEIESGSSKPNTNMPEL